ncbi:MAG: acyltransferase [Anaerolineales bacterium]|nr:acyltransferase [Anaerolineales bacterium]MBX3035677.1 acyltransferase [Anaerolineales bacterium]
MNSQTRLYEFDALRALATLLLLLLHSEVFALDNVFGINLNPFALFTGAFLLGSFFFMAGYFEEISQKKYKNNWLAFIKTKFTRIYPPYWAALILFVFVMGYSLKKPLDQWTYILNLQFIFSPGFVKQLLTLWFISVLVAYYVIFITLRQFIKSEWGLLSVLGIIYLSFYFLHLKTNLFDIRFFEYFFIFFIGGWLMRKPEWMQKINQTSFYLKLIFWFVGCYLLWIVQEKALSYQNPIYLIVVNIYILGSILIFLTLFRTRIGTWKIWAFLSYASFFVYLYHRPIWYVLLKIFPQDTWRNEVLFRLTVGSITAILLCYVFQMVYDRIIELVRKRYS